MASQAESDQMVSIFKVPGLTTLPSSQELVDQNITKENCPDHAAKQQPPKYAFQPSGGGDHLGGNEDSQRQTGDGHDNQAPAHGDPGLNWEFFLLFLRLLGFIFVLRHSILHELFIK